MIGRVRSIAFNTFREAVRDRVLYNLIVFALLLVASSFLFGQISIGIERLILVNLSFAAISAFGIVISIFIGIGLVYKEIDKKTLYTVLTRPVRRWEFVTAKFLGLAGTLVVNAGLMAIGFFVALLLMVHRLERSDAWLVLALYFIVLQLMVITAMALLFSTFSSPMLSAVFTLAIFVIGTFAEDLRVFAQMMQGPARWVTMAVSRIVPNFASFNVVSSIAHGQPVAASLIFYNTLYGFFYVVAALAGATLIFERRNLK